MKDNFYYIEVELLKPENELKDILQRIGIENRNKLYQSCHLIKNRDESKYFLTHFKELFSYYEFINENRINSNKIKMSDEDFFRRNNIIYYLFDNGYLRALNMSYIEKNMNSDINFYVVSEKDKSKFSFINKFKL
jgi:hypothetical protein